LGVPKPSPRSVHKPSHRTPAPKPAARAPKPAKPSAAATAAKPFKVPALRVDPEKYPNLAANPSLERALRIRQALDQGKPRDEAVALADAAIGRRAGHGPKARPARKPRAKR
jgi:hypothetical protein